MLGNANAHGARESPVQHGHLFGRAGRTSSNLVSAYLALRRPHGRTLAGQGVLHKHGVLTALGRNLGDSLPPKANPGPRLRCWLRENMAVRAAMYGIQTVYLVPMPSVWLPPGHFFLVWVTSFTPRCSPNPNGMWSWWPLGCSAGGSPKQCPSRLQPCCPSSCSPWETCSPSKKSAPATGIIWSSSSWEDFCSPSALRSGAFAALHIIRAPERRQRIILGFLGGFEHVDQQHGHHGRCALRHLSHRRARRPPQSGSRNAFALTLMLGVAYAANIGIATSSAPRPTSPERRHRGQLRRHHLVRPLDGTSTPLPPFCCTQLPSSPAWCTATASTASKAPER